MKKAVYPGSFDPPTKGHLDIIERSHKLFDELYVVIMKNPAKTATFTELQREAMLKTLTSQFSNVKVIVGSGLTVNVAKAYNAQYLIRGVRAVTDYDFELQQATANMMLAPDIETLFFLTRPENSFLSSSAAKQIAMNDGDLTGFIPKEIIEDVKKKFIVK